MTELIKKREVRSYSKEYKVEAITLARKIGIKKSSLELGIPEGTISSWMHDARKGQIDVGIGKQTPAIGLSQAAEIQHLREENKALSKDIKRLREENAFLEEASAFFAASRQKLVKKNE
ncbi:MAG: hypothetical protein LBU83_08825 [Bacteroidales bacterium]|jgi:transposase|nr:hypothetical protein [Bacteroidales bacterium]